MDTHYQQLRENGSLVCNSPKIRARLYNQLREDGIKWKTETMGYTGPGKNINRYQPRKWNWNAKKITQWFNQGRFYMGDMLDAYQTYYGYPISWIAELYELEPGAHQHYIIDKMCETPSKYCIFDFVPLRKLIKKIIIVESHDPSPSPSPSSESPSTS